MARFTQYTQAAPCPCYGRGYVIDAQGDFAACTYCEAGEAFAVELDAIKAQHATQPAPAIAPAAQAPDLAPVVAGPARKVAPAVVRRQSSQVPGLVLERRGTVLTFRAGLARITYDVSGGELRMLEVMDGGYLRPRERQHIATTAQAYARKVAA